MTTTLALKGFLKKSFQFKTETHLWGQREGLSHMRMQHKQMKNKKTHKALESVTLELADFNTSILVV